jgi:starch phosphorylase
MDRYAGLDPLPDRISRLRELALDLWWSWNTEARQVFRALDYPLWRRTAHNPVRMLRTMPQATLEQAAANPRFLDVYDRATVHLDAARHAANTWWTANFPDLQHHAVAYFSAEFALHQSLPIYAGGLGVLAGDHCKEASDLGVPLIGLGFMYPQGYFHQHLSADGWQEESYEKLNWEDAPIEPATGPDGSPLIVPVPLGDRSVLVAVWRVRLGRAKLYLLDTDLEENAPSDRQLSARLYGGDRETRAQQEIVLGIGGIRVLRALGSNASVYHLNEGHAGFVVLQRIREFIDEGRSFDDALEEVRRTTVFTTHTPVAAGHDAFPFHLVEKQLAGVWGTLGEHRARFLALGEYDNGSGSLFNMTALALRSSGKVNAVSQLHGEVTRSMWAPIWPGIPPEQAPVAAVTNGVHAPTWLASEMAELFEAHLGRDWIDHQSEPAFWDRVLEIPDDQLWDVRSALRHHLFAFIRDRARSLWTEDRASASRVIAAGPMLDNHTLTIGFARRFTGYKRPSLVFSNPDRLARILTQPGRPVQIVFAGKAHPADDTGKHFLQAVYQKALDPKFAGRIAFVEDYDLHVAHFLIQGCDVWLNNPRKPLEASGTSGMKACMNGVPQLSIGDGWWAEGYNGRNGWLIEGRAHAGGDEQALDNADAEALYHLLEAEIVPAFYDRDERGLPRRWIRTIKEAIRSVTPGFSTRRMVRDYVERMYVPSMRQPATR